MSFDNNLPPEERNVRPVSPTRSTINKISDKAKANVKAKVKEKTKDAVKDKIKQVGKKTTKKVATQAAKKVGSKAATSAFGVGPKATIAFWSAVGVLAILLAAYIGFVVSELSPLLKSQSSCTTGIKNVLKSYWNNNGTEEQIKEFEDFEATAPEEKPTCIGNGTWVYPFEGDPTHTITTFYGIRIHPTTGAVDFHEADDLDGADNEAVFAVDGGTVISRSSGCGGGSIHVDHGNGWVTSYTHLNYTPFEVEVGQGISQGQQVGTLWDGTDACSTGSHLHFGMKYQGTDVEPVEVFFNNGIDITARTNGSGDPSYNRHKDDICAKYGAAMLMCQ